MGEPKIDFNAFTASGLAVKLRKDYLTGKFTMKQLCTKYEMTPHYVKRTIDFFGDDVTIPRDKPGRKANVARNQTIADWMGKGRSVEYIANNLELPARQVIKTIEKYQLGDDKTRARLLGTTRPRKPQQKVPRSSRALSQAKRDLVAIENALTERALVPIVNEVVENARRVVPLEKRMEDKVVKRLHAMYRRQREDVRADGEKFRVKFDDIDFPVRCPISDAVLDYTAVVRSNKRGRRKENAPVLDLRDPAKGWVPGNVCVLAWRASRIKSNATAEMHRRIADFMAEVSSTPLEADAPNTIRLTIGDDQEAAITIRNRSK